MHVLYRGGKIRNKKSLIFMKAKKRGERGKKMELKC